MNGQEQVIQFPLTLTLSPIGGEGIKRNLSNTPSPPGGGRGLGGGGIGAAREPPLRITPLPTFKGEGKVK